MGLFGKKKSDSAELPPLKFPELPKSVPSFEAGTAMKPREAKKIKSAVSQPSMPTMPEMPSMGGHPGTEQPLFVKIDKYRDVVDTLKKLKTRLNDADDVLDKLTQLKEEEDKELAAWNNDLQKIKNQLLDIDKKLFE